jgi:hypothetical protein
MGAADRTVQHLHLRAPSAQAAVHAVHRLEDAMRCASLPDTGERLLLVRRLHLGRLPADLSSQSLSLLIEQRVRAAGGSWVHGEHASAAESPTVFFASRLQAAQAAVRRRAEGRSLTAWYWRAALRGAQIDANDGEFLHSVITLLAQETTAAVSLPSLVADVVAAGHADWLIRRMRQETSRWLLAVSGAPWPVADAMPLRDTDPSAPALRHARPGAAVPVRQMPPSRDWPLWLQAVLRTAPWLPDAVPKTAGRPLHAGQIVGHGAAPMLDLDSAWRQGGERRVKQTEPVSAAQPSGHASDGAPALPVTAPLPSGSPAHVAVAQTPVAQAFGPIAQPPFDVGLSTQAGGLLCLLNVLARLGFADWQALHRDAPLGGLILLQALHRLRLPEDDPAWALAASLPAPPTSQACCWHAPALWQDARITVGHQEEDAISPEVMATLWLTACRRYLRRVARIGLSSLVCRPARMQWSATHLNTRFAWGDADVRVRRAALDIDPGWLDWLGRVVTFHYLQPFEP